MIKTSFSICVDILTNGRAYVVIHNSRVEKKLSILIYTARSVAQLRRGKEAAPKSFQGPRVPAYLGLVANMLRVCPVELAR